MLYEVITGDTLYSISRRYQVPLRSIISLNNIPAPYTLYVGQQLRLPGAKVHEVKKGDTLYSISRKYGVDLSQLAKHNNISSPFSLSVGQKLSIPDSVVRGSSRITSYNVCYTKLLRENSEPHRIAYYLGDLAAMFHGLWNKGRDDVQLRFLDESNLELTKARLALVIRITSYNVCYTKLLRSTQATPPLNTPVVPGVLPNG